VEWPPPAASQPRDSGSPGHTGRSRNDAATEKAPRTGAPFQRYALAAASPAAAVGWPSAAVAAAVAARVLRLVRRALAAVARVGALGARPVGLVAVVAVGRRVLAGAVVDLVRSLRVGARALGPLGLTRVA